MRRTRSLIALAAVLAVVAWTPAARALSNNHINGIGMIDYAAGKPDFHVGSWVKYHIRAKSDMGAIDDYTVTILIAGEEEFWGDPGFWVETWTEVKGQGDFASATLMSYSIFRDSLALPHMQTYMRKQCTGVDERGQAQESVFERPEESLQSRTPVGGQVRWDLIPLGADTVTTPKGTFVTRKVRMEQGTGATGQSGDSTQYTEVRENDTMHLTPHIPISHTAREEIEFLITRKTWLIGRSKDSGPTITMDRSLGTAELVDFGEGGLKSRMLPPERQKSLAQQKAGRLPAGAGPSKATPRKSLTARKTG
jgi:hypothetical protein